MKKILWVEDDADRIKGLMLPIIKSGVDVVIAETFYDALRQVKERHAFDAFIVDLMLPLGSGSGEVSPINKQKIKDSRFLGAVLIHEIRTIYPKTPLFVLSAYTDDADVQNLLANIEITSFLPKPMLGSELAELLK